MGTLPCAELARWAATSITILSRIRLPGRFGSVQLFEGHMGVSFF
jgi:hypothetical protein